MEVPCRSKSSLGNAVKALTLRSALSARLEGRAAMRAFSCQALALKHSPAVRPERSFQIRANKLMKTGIAAHDQTLGHIEARAKSRPRQATAKAARRSPAPAGGRQNIVCGQTIENENPSA